MHQFKNVYRHYAIALNIVHHKSFLRGLCAESIFQTDTLHSFQADYEL